MTEPVFQGWYPEPMHYCRFCQKEIGYSPAYSFCDTCREGDALAAWLEEHCQEDELAKDELYTREINRP